jgi:putative ABC transport system substrate-binding protein
MPPPKVALIISQRIRPYILAAEGIRETLTSGLQAKIDLFELDRFRGRALTDLAGELRKENFDLFIAVGPDAFRFAWTELNQRRDRKIYTMVLEPGRILERARDACGIPLTISPEKQLQLIAEVLPTRKQVGILYNPSFNQAFVTKASDHAPTWGLKVIPMEVSTRKDIPRVLKENWSRLEALLFIPDKTVISESLVQQIIKEALLEGVPAIGYNRFFYESGAALAFIFDYIELGRQTGRLAIKHLSGKPCETEEPLFRAWINERVLKHLGHHLGTPLSPPLEVGP